LCLDGQLQSFRMVKHDDDDDNDDDDNDDDESEAPDDRKILISLKRTAFAVHNNVINYRMTLDIKVQHRKQNNDKFVQNKKSTVQRSTCHNISQILVSSTGKVDKSS